MTEHRSSTALPALGVATRATARLALICLTAFALGGATSFGQALLPDETASLANSVTGWTIPTVALVFVAARSYAEAALGGALSFVALTVGYAVVSTMRGFPFDPTTWAVIGILAGPLVGAAAFALRRPELTARPLRAALGAGLLGGIMIGEGVYGLTIVAATTSPVFWWVAIGAGTAIVVVTAVRLRRLGPVLVTGGVAVATAAAFWAAYVALPLVTGLI